MAQYLLGLYRDYAVPVPPESQQMRAGVSELGDKLEEAGAFDLKGGLQGSAESATLVPQSGGDFLLTDGPYTEGKEHLAGSYGAARSHTANPVEQAFLDAQHAAVPAPGYGGPASLALPDDHRFAAKGAGQG